MSVRLFHVVPAVLMVVFSVSSDPRIAFDTKEFDCGIVEEGRKEPLKAYFTVSNTGDSPLILKKVRPGCGCTVVDYDSVIAPGKSQKISASVRIARYRPGPLSKSISVNSNAVNEENVHLKIKANIQAFISISDEFIHLGNHTGTDSAKNVTLTLTSAKKGLKVSKVIFKSDERKSDKELHFKNDLVLGYDFKNSDTKNQDGLYHYELSIDPVNTEEQSGTGTIEILTNHSRKSVIALRGQIGK